MSVTSTQRLAREQVELVTSGRARALLRGAVVVALLAVAAAAGVRVVADGIALADRKGRMQQDNAALQAEVARLTAELEFERATRAALDKQVGELNQRVVELDSQLDFFHAQSGRPRRVASQN